MRTPREHDQAPPRGAPLRWPSLRKGPVVDVLSRPPVLLAFAVVVVAQVFGVLAPIDEALTSLLRRADAPIGREHAPTVLAVDEAAVARLGPPPWGPEAWNELVLALDRQGLTEVTLADPWPRLVRDPLRPVEGATARLSVPTDAWDGRPVAPLPTDHAPWLAPTDATLSLTTTPATALDELTVDPERWLPCRAGVACSPGERVALALADVPVVSLATVLDAPPGFVTASPGGVLLGVTASPHADLVRVAPDHAAVPWVIATARAVASARGGQRLSSLGPGVEALVLLAVLLVGAAASFGARPRLAAGVVLVVAVTPLLAVQVLRTQPPLAAAVLVALLPPTARAVAVGRGAVRAVRRLSLLVIRAASRAGTLRRRIESADALLDALADVTRAHAQDAPFALLLVDGRRRLRFHGGYGLTGKDVLPEALTSSHVEVAAALAARSGVDASRVLTSGRRARLVPLAQTGEVVGFWLVALPQVGVGPDPRRLARLARWIGERLALPGVAGAFSATTELVPDTPDDEALENLFVAADEERRRWLTAVQRLGVPVLVADVGGNVTSFNPAMQDVLEAASMPRPRTLRELIFRLDGDERLERWMDRLFGENVTIALPWPGSTDLRLAVRPVASDADAGSVDQPLLGYLAWLEPGAFEEDLPRTSHDGDSTELYLPKYGLG